MSELVKALSRFLEREPEIPFDLHVDLRAIFDAARRFASLTSPETIEKAARIIYEFDDAVPKPPYWSDCTEDMVAWYRAAAEAVLRSVEEGET